MGIFDRFTSTKGKDQTTAPKRGVVKAPKAKDTEKKAFANVPAAESKKAKTAEPAAASTTARTTDNAHRVLLRPVVTEKTTRGGARNQYTFEVALQASKADIRQAVHHLYGIMPISVNVVNMSGKAVRFGRTYGRTVNRKKAIVSLPTGKTIDVVSA